MRTINRLNEEIARWAFEIKMKESKNWFISFTNPTAGPWKTVKGQDKSGNVGEVYRFPLEENRPDIILYSDNLKAIIIFEAKDSIEKLLEKEQIKKSSEVVINLSKILSKNHNNNFWQNREKYQIFLGLLWGAENVRVDESVVKRTFDLYREQVKNSITVNSKIIFGIETLYADKKMECKVITENYSFDKETENLIKNSLI